MPRDGSGNMNLVSGNPVVSNTVISSTWANSTLSDVASALTQSISRDGQTTPTADLTMGNFKLRNLASALARTDAINAGQVQDGSVKVLGSVSGTNTITASSSPAITAYTAGQEFNFVSAGANIAGGVTLNINALGAQNVYKYGTTALVAGDIAAGQMVSVVYDGTQFQLRNPANGNGRLINVQVFTSSGTYTPTPGMGTAIVEVQAGGGGTGGAPATGASQYSGSSSAPSGTYAMVRLTAAQIGASLIVTIGAGGTAGASGSSTGGTGGTTTFGPLISCPGGNGSSSYGPTAATVTIVNAPSVGAVPTVSSGTTIISSQGNIGLGTIGSTGGGVLAAPGGASPINKSNYGPGAGGAGQALGASAAALVGAVGGAGKVIVWEFA